MHPKFIRVSEKTYSLKYFEKSYPFGKKQYREYCIQIDGKIHHYKDIDGGLQCAFESFLDYLEENGNCWGTCFNVDHFALNLEEERVKREKEFDDYCRECEKNMDEKIT